MITAGKLLQVITCFLNFDKRHENKIHVCKVRFTACVITWASVYAFFFITSDVKVEPKYQGIDTS